jgi:starch synthase (maltosyl-transferring)
VNSAVLSVTDLSARRIFIEDVYPSVDAGRFAVKRVAGEAVEVWADIFREGHALLAADLVWKPAEGSERWQRVVMQPGGNDRWTATFVPPSPGRYVYAIEAWTDVFGTWRRDLLAKQKRGSRLLWNSKRAGNLWPNCGAAHGAPRVPPSGSRGRTAGHGGACPTMAPHETTRLARKTFRADLTRSDTLRWSPTVRWRGPEPGTRWCRAARAAPRAATAPSTIASPASPTSRGLASTWST